MHFMIDIETLSTKANARISEIACVMFDEQHINSQQYYARINPFLYQDDRHICPDTMKFWDKLGVTLGRFNCPEIPLHEALLGLRDYMLGQADVYGFAIADSKVWCKGTDFDICILRDAGFEFPQKYNNIRDMRTVKKMCSPLPPAENLSPHWALHDCFAQVHDLQNIISASGGVLSLK